MRPCQPPSRAHFYRHEQPACTAELKAVELRVDREYAPGQPISAWCGPQPNSRLLLNYGGMGWARAGGWDGVGLVDGMGWGGLSAA